MKRLHLLILAVTILLWPALAAGQVMSVGGYNVYFGHLHNHCSYSDGSSIPDSAYKYAKTKSRLDFFALSDHNYLLSSTEWKKVKAAADKYQQDGVFTGLWGFEWTHLTQGHVTVVGTSSNNLSTTLANLCTWLNNQSAGVAFFNHPGEYDYTDDEFVHFSTTPTSKMVGMELWNGSNGFSHYYYNDGYYSGDGNKGFYDEAISRGWKIGAAGSEDNHSTNWGNAVSSKMAILAASNNRSALMAALQAKRFYSTLDKNLALSFKIGNSEMGSTVTADTYNLTIEARDGDSESFSEVALVRNGVVVNTWTPDASTVNIFASLTFYNGEYYYVRVKQADGDEAISSPIWIIAGVQNMPPVVSITAPASGTSYTVPAVINIAISASDSDGSIAGVTLKQNGIPMGTITSLPYTATLNISTPGTYVLTAEATDDDGAVTTSAPVTITVTDAITTCSFSQRINTAMDDVEETSSGIMYTSSDDLELVYDSWLTGNQYVGLRFNGITLPNGATITRAWIQFTVDEATTSSASLSIRGQNVDNAPAFSTSLKNVSGRAKTSAYTSWVPATWPSVGAAGTAQQTPDLKSIVQELVNRAGWSAGNSMVFIITGSGKRTARAYDGSPSTAAVLNIEHNCASATAFKNAAISSVTFGNPAEQDLRPGELLCYPVPCENLLNVRFTPGENETLSRVEIYGVDGRKITMFENCDNLIPVPVNDYIPGIYLVKAITNQRTYVQTVIKR